MVIATFADLGRALQGQPPLRAAVAGAEDQAVMDALFDAMDLGLVSEATLTGNAAALRGMLPADRRTAFTVIEAADTAVASALAVAEVRAGRADVLVKGSVDSAAYLRAILSRDSGLRAGPVLANVTIAEMASVPRLIGATDNGILPLPTLDQKRAILLAAVPLFRGLGVSPLHVAAIAASEKVSAAQPATVDAQALAAESRAGTLPGLIVDGPFGYDVALSGAAAAKKGLGGSAVAGRADLILFPSLESGNATVKAWKLHGGARTGSLVLGATVPVLLNSRADGAEQRRLGLLLALAMKLGQRLGA
ncbi:MAG: phosphate acyltransferase [Paracoccaceae bacterium]